MRVQPSERDCFQVYVRASNKAGIVTPQSPSMLRGKEGKGGGRREGDSVTDGWLGLVGGYPTKA